jgi:hypothetical protein
MTSAKRLRLSTSLMGYTSLSRRPVRRCSSLISKVHAIVRTALDFREGPAHSVPFRRAESKKYAGISNRHVATYRQVTYRANDGATRRFVACSNANASSTRRGSLHAIPLKLTPNGAGCAMKPSGNGRVSAFGTKPKGTITVG